MFFCMRSQDPPEFPFEEAKARVLKDYNAAWMASPRLHLNSFKMMNLKENLEHAWVRENLQKEAKKLYDLNAERERISTEGYKLVKEIGKLEDELDALDVDAPERAEKQAERDAKRKQHIEVCEPLAALQIVITKVQKQIRDAVEQRMYKPLYREMEKSQEKAKEEQKKKKKRARLN